MILYIKIYYLWYFIIYTFDKNFNCVFERWPDLFFGRRYWDCRKSYVEIFLRSLVQEIRVHLCTKKVHNKYFPVTAYQVYLTRVIVRCLLQHLQYLSGSIVFCDNPSISCLLISADIISPQVKDVTNDPWIVNSLDNAYNRPINCSHLLPSAVIYTWTQIKSNLKSRNW